MFSPKDIAKLLKICPFAPFRIQMSHGDTYDIRHPDQAVVTRTHVYVGTPLDERADGEGVYDSFALLAIVHITQIRPLLTSAGGRSRRTRRKPRPK